MPKQEGRNMIMVISPNKRYMEQLARAKAAAPEPRPQPEPQLQPEPVATAKAAEIDEG
jgi:hypothetical protein